MRGEKTVLNLSLSPFIKGKRNILYYPHPILLPQGKRGFQSRRRKILLKYLTPYIPLS
jgi:hypothetical protein